MAAERKTTEIKLRVTPAEKAAWQLAAEDEGIGLSELVRREMNARAAQRPSHPEFPPILFTEVSDADLASVQPYKFPAVVTDSVPPDFVILTNVSSDAEVEDSSIERAVPTSDAESRVAKPWMFEARSSE